MARTKAELPKDARITDYISLGVIGMTFTPPVWSIRDKMLPVFVHSLENFPPPGKGGMKFQGYF